MNKKIFKSVLCCIISLLLFSSILPSYAEQSLKTDDSAQSIIDGILSYKTNEKHLIDEITENAGSAEWYAVALSQYGSYDFTDYESALLKYLSENKVSSASSRQKYALTLIALGSTDSYIYNTLNDSIGKQGVMSWIFGLHLLNNRYKSDEYPLTDVKQKLLSLQKSDGGWAVTGNFGDVDATAMAVQALAPYYSSDTDIKSAIDRALELLSQRQNDSGDYSSYGVANPESTAQVLIALSSLGIDCKTDSRFIKNGNTLFDAIEIYKLQDGSFCHKKGGNSNETATVQVLCSMVSYLRMQKGKSALYMLDFANPDGLKIPVKEESILPDEPSDTENNHSSEVVSKIPSSPTINSTTSEETDSSYCSEETSTAESEEETSADAPTTDNTVNTEDIRTEAKSSYKLWVSIAVTIITAGICLTLYILKRRNIKNFIFIALVYIAVIGIVLFTNFSSAKAHYNKPLKENVIGTVSISIRCDAISDEKSDHIPDNGIILEASQFPIDNNDTVYDILLEATAKNKIHLETNSIAESAYVEGINNIYEFDYGDLSGWVFYVNGESPSVSCGEYKLSPDDEIEWIYTR